MNIRRQQTVHIERPLLCFFLFTTKAHHVCWRALPLAHTLHIACRILLPPTAPLLRFHVTAAFGLGRGTEAGRRGPQIVVLLVLLGHSQPEALAHSPLGPAAPEVTPDKVVHVGRMYGPVVALAVGAAARLHEAVVERQIVSDRVAPAGAPRVEVRVVVQYPLVDVAEHQFFVRGAQDSERYEPDVAVGGLGLLGPSVRPVYVLAGVVVVVGAGGLASGRRGGRGHGGEQGVGKGVEHVVGGGGRLGFVRDKRVVWRRLLALAGNGEQGRGGRGRRARLVQYLQLQGAVLQAQLLLHHQVSLHQHLFVKVAYLARIAHSKKLQSYCRDQIWVVQSLYQLIHFAEQFLDSEFCIEKLN
ncbi:hypothetical protein BpHYR1_000696 [Brachionus plicatilis]|uniref:Uncharacterized protein n=1 Tax=Brachionus plicatilis TaxID=10195 RepID=A0A3M7T5N7_BRAPC|nr:hypothetical protein BpHYR1_000696 [Brachionus plicatilis]